MHTWWCGCDDAVTIHTVMMQTHTVMMHTHNDQVDDDAHTTAVMMKLMMHMATTWQ